MNYYIGLDNGGTTTKASVFDETGAEIATARAETKMLVPHPGYTERDMEEMWAANCRVLHEALALAKIDPANVRCVACCGHGKGLYLWGKNGKPVRPGIISTDNRAWEYPKRWEAQGIAERVFERSCQHILASQPVSLLAWLRDNEPGAIENTQYIFECKDYVRFRLTGEAFAERTDYSGANFVSLHTGEYDPELLRLFGLEDCRGKLPPLIFSTDIAGYVTAEAARMTGLAEGTPVAGGAFDIDACALALNVTDANNICMIAGTWSINEYLSKSVVTDGSVMMNSFSCLPGYFLIEECSPTSAGNLEWFIAALMPELKRQAKETGNSVYDLINGWVAQTPPETFCPVFLPFLMASNVHPNAMGCFVGLSNYHTRAHLLRAVYEGVAFSHRYHFERLMASRAEKPKTIRLAGGAAKSAVWAQMFADVLKYPVEAVDVNETGALGCAIIGAVASGAYDSLPAAAAKMCKMSPSCLPDEKNAAVYEQKYRLYKATIEALDPLWNRMQALRDSLAKFN
ncbi:MAG TPA: FGGY-family carbohydrate kinase [Eubacteriales bacterium]|nr:FGGY-family carbohydrate kinase [Eubacteriales bacterium]